MHTEFLLSILINNKLLNRGGGAFGPTQRAVLRFIGDLSYVNTYCFTFTLFMRTKFQIYHLNNLNRGAFGPMTGPFRGPGWGG